MDPKGYTPPNRHEHNTCQEAFPKGKSSSNPAVSGAMSSKKTDTSSNTPPWPMTMLLNTTHLAGIDRYNIPATSLQKKAQTPIKTGVIWVRPCFSRNSQSFIHIPKVVSRNCCESGFPYGAIRSKASWKKSHAGPPGPVSLDIPGHLRTLEVDRTYLKHLSPLKVISTH